MQRIPTVASAALACLATFAFGVAHSQDEPASPESQSQTAWDIAAAAMQRGTADISLGNQAQLHLPEGYGYIPTKEGAQLMEAMGNRTDDRFLGLIVPLSEAEWFVSIDYEPSGYIEDDDAKNWDADELLDNLKEGTEAGNRRREQMGIPPIMVTRWVESPSYEQSTHQLVWSAEARLKNGDDPDPTINYNTYVLGREGYVSLNLITSASTIETDKLSARELLAAVNFNDGKRYGDFNSSTDKVAAYGLAALVGGVAAKKLGLLAVIGAFVAKFAKLIFVGVVAVGGGIAKWFRGRGSDASAS